ncbi:MAG: quinone-dependent dihydroorotate dehydrogenase [Polyangiaceae bacterium]|nr:quinone-dependent dihydroorotate dehydrogenase [Polyangiaceae bacterium]
MRLYDVGFRFLKLFPAEPIHEVVFGALRGTMAIPGVRGAVRRALAPAAPSLEVRAFGVTFPGPVGLAAGFDKNALGPDALAALGFGFVEVGTVTARAQDGNPKPRLFRLPADRALVNRMGFNNHGAERVSRRLDGSPPASVVAVNIGKTKVVSEAEAADDYAQSARLLGRHAAFVVVNVSSPNTPGLRDLQRAEALAPILDAVRTALDESVTDRRVPLLVKIAPDLADEDVDAVADLAVSRGLDGIVLTNTTISRARLASSPSEIEQVGAGGLSGEPLRERSLALLSRVYRRVGKRLVLVSVGGIATAEDAWQRITHGATLLELYTSFIYEGPLVAYRIHDGLRTRLAERGLERLEQAVGLSIQSSHVVGDHP